MYTDNDPHNPITGVVVSDLFLPEEWANDRQRCQEAGFGAIEVRTYRNLIHHWLCSRMAMYFLAA